MEGKGKFTSVMNDGVVSFSNQSKYGKTEETQGFVYDGDFHLDQPHGKGELDMTNQFFYLGNFEKGTMHGSGVQKVEHQSFDWKLHTQDFDLARINKQKPKPLTEKYKKNFYREMKVYDCGLVQ